MENVQKLYKNARDKWENISITTFKNIIHGVRVDEMIKMIVSDKKIFARDRPLFIFIESVLVIFDTRFINHNDGLDFSALSTIGPNY